MRTSTDVVSQRTHTRLGTPTRRMAWTRIDPPSAVRSCGGLASRSLRRWAEILTSLFNAIGLLVLTGWIVYESIERLQSPVQIVGPAMVAVATVGLLVNVVTAWILGRSGAEDLNTRSALLHMLGDMFSSVVIVVGGIVLIQTQTTLC